MYTMRLVLYVSFHFLHTKKKDVKLSDNIFSAAHGARSIRAAVACPPPERGDGARDVVDLAVVTEGVGEIPIEFERYLGKNTATNRFYIMYKRNLYPASIKA